MDRRNGKHDKIKLDKKKEIKTKYEPHTKPFIYLGGVHCFSSSEPGLI